MMPKHCLHHLLLIGWASLLALTYDVQSQNSSSSTEDSAMRQKRLFSVFNIIQFQNGPCSTASGLNGTCYTLSECTAKNGMSSGSCAGGFGVCCTFSLECGETVAESCVFITKPTGPLPSPCNYRICKCNPNICRIKLDFQMFDIAQPGTNSIVLFGKMVNTEGALDTSLGDCIEESFTVSSPGVAAPPVICGFNTGQHMFLDASDNCNELVFNTRQGSTANWDIKVTQYKCGSDEGGPPGCLQYFTGTMGTVASYNFPTSSSTVPPTATHLSNQCYSMCFRQEPNNCAICFIPVVLGTPTMQGSFGLSNPNTRKPNSVAQGKCSTDYIRLPSAQGKGGTKDESFEVGKFDASEKLYSKLCGRFWAANSEEKMDGAYVCSQMRPFRLDFKTDANEVVQTEKTQSAKNSELVGVPGGTVGFNLKWSQVPC